MPGREKWQQMSYKVEMEECIAKKFLKWTLVMLTGHVANKGDLSGYVSNQWWKRGVEKQPECTWVGVSNEMDKMPF
jgi:hypothetical protein